MERMLPTESDFCDQPSPQVVDRQQQNLNIAEPLRAVLDEFQQLACLGTGQVLVVGASSSEVAGQRIGTATSMAIGQQIVDIFLQWSSETGCQLAFQCCEHLNRALVVNRQLAMTHGWQEVSAIPVPGAGGAVAAAAYRKMSDACLVSAIAADAGVDIGDTLIGMHLKPVAVPVRVSVQSIGHAHLVLARTRPPLIGGMRAVYSREEAEKRWLAK